MLRDIYWQGGCVQVCLPPSAPWLLVRHLAAASTRLRVFISSLSGRCAPGHSTVLTYIDQESWKRGMASTRNFDQHPAFLSSDQHTERGQPRHQCCCCWLIRGGKCSGRGTPRRQERRRLDRRGQCKTVRQNSERSPSHLPCRRQQSRPNNGEHSEHATVRLQ